MGTAIAAGIGLYVVAVILLNLAILGLACWAIVKLVKKFTK
jgi:hypothetical protein